LQPLLRPQHFQRSRLLDEAVAVFGNGSAASTDIVMELFVPASRLARLLAKLREAQRAHPVDVLNVTLRHVLRDDDTFLRYADQPMHCAVFLIHQPFTPEAEAAMQRAARSMIQAALDCGGRYYLPYRSHATPEQFHAGYPKAKEFFALKRKYDPEELFQNKFYQHYARRSETPSPEAH
jgi:FAD/FMN-containing dehydrogenase